jgi:nitronate monooxygenase
LSTVNFQIIQGGMGAGVSNWHLARTVSMQGQLGVVSGIALDLIMVRRLQLGDPDGDVRRALSAFPVQSLAEEILEKYWIDGGKSPDEPFKSKPMVGHKQSAWSQQLLVVGSFVEVFLAKENHDGLVGINFLEKIQSPTLPAMYGALLADVDVVICGAGIPRQFPIFLNQFVNKQPAELKLAVTGAAPANSHVITFDPRDVMGDDLPDVRRPKFFPIVSSVILANMMVKKTPGCVDGLIIEAPTAGGHNAPPRGKLQLDENGEPIYGPRDEVDLDEICALGLPFWLAGSYGHPDQLNAALAAGATGIQVGTLFAFSNESGLEPSLKHSVIDRIVDGNLKVYTDPIASPTGFPFKVIQLDGTNSDAARYEERKRVCDLGYLRESYEKADGSVGWRCCSDVVDLYVRAGGSVDDTVGRKCLCNGLMANIGLGQTRKDTVDERPLLTCGDDTGNIPTVLNGRPNYSAVDVLEFLKPGSTSSVNDALTANESA